MAKPNIQISPRRQSIIRRYTETMNQLRTQAQILESALQDTLSCVVDDAGEDPSDGWTLAPDLTELVPASDTPDKV